MAKHRLDDAQSSAVLLPAFGCVDLLLHFCRVSPLHRQGSILEEHHLPRRRSLRMAQTSVALRARLAVHLRPLKLHRLMAADPARTAVAVERLAGGANASLARRIVNKVRRAIAAALTLALLGQVPCTMAPRRRPLRAPRLGAWRRLRPPHRSLAARRGRSSSWRCRCR